MKISENKTYDFIAKAVTLLFIAMGAAVSLNRFWQYEVFYYDFGIFDQAIWNVSRFRPPIIEHLVVGGMWIFADHFNPSIFLLSPLYWFSERQEIILAAQAVAIGLSGFVLYLTVKKILSDKLFAISLLLTFFLFVGLQNSVITDFHEVTVSTLPLSLVFWAFINNRKRLFFAFLLLTLGFKESTFLLGAGIGVFILYTSREWRKIGISTILISLLWGFISIKLIIPFFSGGIYQYSSLNSSNPGLYSFFDNPEKIRTLFFSFLSFGFLPLFSPALFLSILQDFLIRFIPNTPTRWGLGLHYSAQLAILMTISSAYGWKFLRKNKTIFSMRMLVAALLIINSIVLHQIILHGPFGLAYNPAFYKHSKNFSFLNDLISKVPPDASVMTHNNLAAHFTHQDVKLLRSNYYTYKPEYIVIDLRDGQNPNNFFGGLTSSEMNILLKEDENYKVFYHTKEQYIYKRIE